LGENFLATQDEEDRATVRRFGIHRTNGVAGVRATSARTRVLTRDALLHCAGNGAEWLSYMATITRKRTSAAGRDPPENVKRLSLAWSARRKAPQGTVEATPLMHDGVLYGILPGNVMYAVDARTGQEKWRWDSGCAACTHPGLCCGPVNRGVALYNGRVYAGLLDGRVVAVDAETGELIWSTQDTVPGGDTTLTSAVTHREGQSDCRVERRGTGRARLLLRPMMPKPDSACGASIPFPVIRRKPFEHPELEQPPKTLDGRMVEVGRRRHGVGCDGLRSAADLLYVGTGNGGPWNQKHSQPAGGDNLYSLRSSQ
jgi:hypothetical protein